MFYKLFNVACHEKTIIQSIIDTFQRRGENSIKNRENFFLLLSASNSLTILKFSQYFTFEFHVTSQAHIEYIALMAHEREQKKTSKARKMKIPSENGKRTFQKQSGKAVLLTSLDQNKLEIKF